jgi:hypothetical protein
MLQKPDRGADPHGLIGRRAFDLSRTDFFEVSPTCPTRATAAHGNWLAGPAYPAVIAKITLAPVLYVRD